MRSISASVNASTSSGLRLVTILPSVTAAWSTTFAPAFLRSVRIDGQLVTVRPRTRSASTSSHGPWQMAPIGFPWPANLRIRAMTLACSRLVAAAGAVSPRFDLPAFELRDLELSDAMDELLLTDAIRPGSPGELILTDADRLDGSEPLLLDDILAKIDAGARVVRLFDRKAMPTPGQLQSRIATHLGEASRVDVLTDAAQALSDALAELRRSLG